jgi:hypothetical protein
MNTTKSDRHSAPYLTKIEGCPDRGALKGGMAHFAGSGPPGQTCGDCQHLDRAIRKGISKARCVMFQKLMGGRKGEFIDPKFASCKYFMAKPRKPSVIPRSQGAGISAAEAELLRKLNNRPPPHLK